MINSWIILTVLLLYFGVLMLISRVTSRNAGNEAYFLGNRASPWYAVALGMIGDSLSGVTFISVPGAVSADKFSYFQLVLGYFFGYLVITQVLLPLYYRLQLTSIYSYLRIRFGTYAEKTGSLFFLLSRLLGAGARLFLAAGVIQLFVMTPLGVPFPVSVSLIILLMLVYTYKGGIKTLVWTDVMQSMMLLLGVVLSIIAISSALELDFSGLLSVVSESEKSTIFFWDWQSRSFFPKQFIGGALIAVTMTGLDQNMMQKNLSCRSLPEAQKNIRWFSVVLIVVNFFFLALGVLLYEYAAAFGIGVPLSPTGEPATDLLFPTLALNHLGMFAGLVFIVGLIAATFSSADSVLTTLTTSFYIDFLRADDPGRYSEKRKLRIRQLTHIVFAILLWLVIMIFSRLNDDAIINTVLRLANYTYGPLLGLFAFGVFTKRKAFDPLIPVICIAAPLFCWLLSTYSPQWLGGYEFGHELLGVNGLLVFIGLWLSSKKDKTLTLTSPSAYATP